jgi:hypothetical protein
MAANRNRTAPDRSPHLASEQGAVPRPDRFRARGGEELVPVGQSEQTELALSFITPDELAARVGRNALEITYIPAVTIGHGQGVVGRYLARIPEDYMDRKTGEVKSVPTYSLAIDDGSTVRIRGGARLGKLMDQVKPA